MEGKKKVRGEGAKWGEGSRKQRIKGRKENEEEKKKNLDRPLLKSHFHI